MGLMNPGAKLLILVGSLLIVAGLIWQFGGKYLHLGRLPGDIVIERENIKIYFPIMTSVLVTLFLSFAAYLFRYFGGEK